MAIDAVTPPADATVRFVEHDTSVLAVDRGFYGFPATKRFTEDKIKLHDVRHAPELVKGPGGLDVQGFAYVKHRSALADSDRWHGYGDLVENTYIPEVQDLICSLTGAKKAVVNNVAFRLKPTSDMADPTFVYKRGCAEDQKLSNMPRDHAMVIGKVQDQALEPTRVAHIDYSTKGLRDSVRYCRDDIKSAGQNALDAEDAHAEDVPRYAAYSVWRPLKTVKRDPLAVCDWRTVNPATELQPVDYRALSNINENGEYMMEAQLLLPQEHPDRQKWYWMPEQTPEDVLVVKFADTASETDPNVSGGCVHASPTVHGTEDEQLRSSVECRVLAFW